MTQFNIAAYLSVFLDEVEEQLQLLSVEVVELEKDATNQETIQNIFRAAHTLKGSSAAMGFDKMKEFTHHLENVFDSIRQQQMTVTPALINIILESVDFLYVLREAIVSDTLQTIDIEPHVQKLVAYQDSQQSQEQQRINSSEPESILNTLSAEQKKELLHQHQSGNNILELRVTLDEQALMKNVRILVIYTNLQEVGEVFVTLPSMTEIESEAAFSGEWTCILATEKTKEAVTKWVQTMPDVKKVIVQDIPTGLLETPRAEAAAILPKKETVRPPEEAIQKAAAVKAKVQPTVRVDVDKLEHLMNLVGELVIDQTRLVDAKSRLSEKKSAEQEDMDILDEVTNHLSRVITELQEGMMKTRMLPIEQLFNRFPRMVRDTASKANKQIDFIVTGKETELDRTLIEEISDPIIHLLRNAIDHGIEPPDERESAGKSAFGKVELRAAHVENHIVITIKDDGKGIDPEKIKATAVQKELMTKEEADKMTDRDALFFIFKSGVSTAKEVTDISGRGVGMDIVRAHIEKLNGMIDIESEVGVGTTFTIKLPLTLAIIRSLLVKFGDKTFAIPLVNVLEIIRLNKEDIQIVKEKEVGVVRGRVLPLVRMKEKMNIAHAQEERSRKSEFVVVVGIADKRIGLIADKTIGNQEIVIKSLGPYIGSPPYISGATLMGDGSVALILDISSVVREEGTQDVETQDDNKKRQAEEEAQFITFKLEKEEYGIDIERIKDIVAVPEITKMVQGPADLLGMINLRGFMVPVIDLRKRFSLPVQEKTKKSRVIVVDGEEQDLGFLVDEVTQVMKTSKSFIEPPPDEHHYHHSALFKGISKAEERVVLLLECDEILRTVKLPSSQEQHVMESTGTPLHLGGQ